MERKWIVVTASRWPWQLKSTNIFGMHLGRFGGGWQYKFGIAIGGRTVILDLIWGSLRITFPSRRSPNAQ